MAELQTSGKAHTGNTVRENHRDTDSHMLPCTQVIASPHGSIPLGTGIEGTGEDEGTLVRSRSLFNGLRCNIHEKHSVDIVNISVLPTAIMDGIFLHRNFWPVEDRWLSKKGKENQR